MIKILGKIPSEKFYLACSGGIDSAVALDFLLRYPKNDMHILYFNHGTEHAQEAEQFVRNKCKELNIPLTVGNILIKEKSENQSWEEYWRKERYRFFNTFVAPIITAHHLNDSCEWYLFSALHGKGKLIPYQNGNVIRPFLLTSKKDILNWAERKNVEYIDDPSNKDEKYMRNLIRHKIMPLARMVNPGLEKVMRKKYLKKL